MNVVQTTPTSLPTGTPTPSATPIRYTVEEGDTLLGIAIDNLTTVEEIETLNPGVVPELLQIGQSLALPPPATPVFTGQSATPVPLQTEVRAVQIIRTPVGSMWLLGELVNHGAYPIVGPQVQIDLIGPDNALLGSASAWVAPGVLRPGEHGPFATLLREPPSEEVQPSVSVVAGDALVEPGSYYFDLAVADSEVNIEDGLVNVAGSVENIGEDVATSISVVATFYGASGEVTGYAQQHLQNPLLPGEEARFEVGGSPPGGQTVDVTIGVYGLKEHSSPR
jgi:LysM repeat protein